MITALLESVEGENDPSNDSMINLHKSYVAKLGFKLEIPGSAVRCTNGSVQEWLEC